MVPLVLETGVQVEASCRRAEECLRYRGRGAPAVRFRAAGSLFRKLVIPSRRR